MPMRDAAGTISFQQLEALDHHVGVKIRETRDVSAGTRQAGDEPGADRIGASMTIGTVVVTFFAAVAADVDVATMTSALRRTSSAARSKSFSDRPRPDSPGAESCVHPGLRPRRATDDDTERDDCEDDARPHGKRAPSSSRSSRRASCI
jgi:hypothetical protein